MFDNPLTKSSPVIPDTHKLISLEPCPPAGGEAEEKKR
jgi:hypothetical protein